MKKILFIVIFIIGLLPAVIRAEVNLPQPVQELFDIAGKVKLNSETENTLQNAVKDAAEGETQPIELIKSLGMDLKALWEKINTWFINTLGVTLGEVLRAVGNIFVWIFEEIIKLIRFVLSKT